MFLGNALRRDDSVCSFWSTDRAIRDLDVKPARDFECATSDNVGRRWELRRFYQEKEGGAEGKSIGHEWCTKQLVWLMLISFYSRSSSDPRDRINSLLWMRCCYGQQVSPRQRTVQEVSDLTLRPRPFRQAIGSVTENSGQEYSDAGASTEDAATLRCVGTRKPVNVRPDYHWIIHLGASINIQVLIANAPR